MALLVVTLTTAGIAAVVNAQNTGTDPVTISEVGFTATPFAAGAATAAIPGELKRLSTLSGDVVAADTIHLTVRDESADAYSLTGFGLYLADGTLFAVYSQATAILEKAAAALALLAIDIKLSEIDAAALTFGDTNFLDPPATEATPGVIQIASDAEIATGAIGTKAVQPRGLKALLDSRFGAGAPSAFVKGLLTAATALAFRAAIGCGTAATKDVGAGNGLDADLLDGQHGAYYLDWANLTGKPATFAPSPHTHVWADITNPPVYTTRWPQWSEVTGKPTTFTPSAHTHVWADITNPPVQTSRWPAWSEVTSKPATFTPSAHTHDAADIVSGVLAAARIPALSIAQTTGLQAALDGKIPTSASSGGVSNGNGWFKLPSGLIVQTLFVNSVNSAGTYNFTWPIAFTNQCLASSLVNRGDVETCYLSIVSDNATGGYFNVSGTAPGSVYIIAVGY